MEDNMNNLHNEMENNNNLHNEESGNIPIQNSSDQNGQNQQSQQNYAGSGNGYTGSGNNYSASGNNYTGSGSGNTGSGSGYNGHYNYSNTPYTSYNPSGNGDGRKPKKSHKAGKAVLAVALAAVMCVSVGFGAWGVSTVIRAQNEQNTEASAASGSSDSNSNGNANGNSDASSSSSSSESTQKAELTTTTESSGASGDTSVVNVAQNVMPSIVSVYNNYTQQSTDFFGQSYTQQGESTGSGIIISKTDDELLIVTNNHVVEGEDSLSVQFIDETTADAQIKGTDAGNDLAVIAVKLSDLSDDTKNKIKVATLGDSDSLQVGQQVVAIGNALGYGQSVTTGVVSALNREITTEDGATNTFIQTDAAINPGNSGGALVDMNGNVIGINSNKIGGETVEGMGYAIPITRATPIIKNLMNQTTKSKVSDENKGYLGISGVSVTSQVASAYNMPQGVYVAKILNGSGAAESGLKTGDIITGINGSSILDMEDLQNQLQYYSAGETVTLTIERSSNGEYKEQEIKLTLSDSSVVKSESGTQNSQNGQGSNGSGSGSEQGGAGSSQNQSGSTITIPFFGW